MNASSPLKCLYLKKIDLFVSLCLFCFSPLMLLHCLRGDEGKRKFYQILLQPVISCGHAHTPARARRGT